MQTRFLQRVAAAANRPIVLVLVNGGPISLPWAAASADVGAIVEAWYGGAEAGTALADVLFGRWVASGGLRGAARDAPCSRG